MNDQGSKGSGRLPVPRVRLRGFQSARDATEEIANRILSGRLPNHLLTDDGDAGPGIVAVLNACALFARIYADHAATKASGWQTHVPKARGLTSEDVDAPMQPPEPAQLDEPGGFEERVERARAQAAEAARLAKREGA